MGTFKFRLQSYLNIKEKLEDQKKNEYGQAMAALEREKQEKAAIEAERSDCLGDFKRSVSSKIDPLTFQRYNMYIDVLKKKEKKQEEIVLSAQETAEKKRVELVERMRERKMLDTLKEKDHVEFIKEEKRMEQKLVDEIVSYRYNNREND